MSEAKLARRARWLRWMVNLYPPYLGAGVWLSELSPDFRYARVKLRLNRLNRNYVGTQFGGSLYSMTDPFYMLMLMNILGRDYIVWDKAAKIDFIRPGRSAVGAEFRISAEQLAQIQQQTASGDKYLPVFAVLVRDAQGHLVAKVEKTLYVRRKPHSL